MSDRKVEIGVPGGKSVNMAAPAKDYDKDTGEWGHLPGEPCRFCREVGGVYFNIDDGPEGKVGLQAQRCDRCKRTWTADSSLA